MKTSINPQSERGHLMSALSLTRCSRPERGHLLSALYLLAATITVQFSFAAEPAVQPPPETPAKYQAGQSLEPFRKIEAQVRASLTNSSLRAQTEQTLIEILGPDSTPEAKLFACKQLSFIGTKASLPALSRLLADPATAGFACLALGSYPPGPADAALRNALQTTYGLARAQVINTLGDRRDARSVREIAAATRSLNPDVADAAVASLGKIGTPEAAKILLALRREGRIDLNPVVTEATLVCADHLARDGHRKQAAAIYDDLVRPAYPAYVRRSALSGLLRLDKDLGEARIAQLLSGSDSILKPVAIAAIPAVPGKHASANFAALLPRLSPQEQAWLVTSLAARADAPARDAIAQALCAGELEVRLAAITALGQIGNSDTVPLLVQRLSTPDKDERRALETALIGLPGAAATDRALTQALATSAGDIRADLINVVSRRQGSAVQTLMITEARSESPQVARAALRALSRIGNASIANEILDLLVKTKNAQTRSEAESTALQLLAKLQDPAQRSALVCAQLKSATTVEARAALISLLPACGDTTALTAVNTALKDPDPDIREAATRALAEWPDPTPWSDLRALWAKAESATLRGIALRGLVRMAADQSAKAAVVDRYKELVATAQDQQEWKQILGAIGGAHFLGTLELALPFLEKAEVRAEAEVAIKKIAEALKKAHPKEAQAALEAITRK